MTFITSLRYLYTMSESQKDFIANGCKVRKQPFVTGLSYGKWLTVVGLTGAQPVIRQYYTSGYCRNLEVSMYIN